MAKNPQDRYDNAREMLADLRAALGGEEAMIQSPAVGEAAVVVPGRRRRWMIAGGSALAAAVVAAAVIAGRGGWRQKTAEQTEITSAAPVSAMPAVAAIAAPAVMPAPAQAPALAAGSLLVNSIQMKLALIPAGKFMMGDAALPDAPPHQVTISSPFYMSIYVVTQAEQHAVMGTTVRRENWPVARYLWPQANRFCQLLSILPQEQKAGRVYRLPTEAEWEYACRAGTTTRYCYGDTLTPGMANFGKAPTTTKAGLTLPGLVEAGGFPPNAWGLYDMHGNVWQWCSDFYAPGYDTSQPAVDPTGPASGTSHVARGGCWNSTAEQCASAYRCGKTADLATASQVGLRVVCIVER
jgi:formylglycine-generating enzyme required for sulfatase activity